MPEEQRRWSVWRQDDWGQEYLVEAGLTQAQAEALAQDLENRGHKQTYWVREQS